MTSCSGCSSKGEECKMVKEEDGDIEMSSIKPSIDDDEKESSAQQEMSRAPLIALCFAMFVQSYALMNPVPYCGFMVMHYGVTNDAEKVGYYAGFVMTAFMLGRFMSSFYCGRLADRISRKFVIRISLWSCVVFQLLFGLSPNFRMALVARGAMGLFNGLAGVAKAALPDLVPKSEQQTAMGYVTNMWSLGMIAGPAAGGLLAEKGFESFPYLLPNAIGSLLGLFAVACVEIYMPSGHRREEKDDYSRVTTTEEGAEELPQTTKATTKRRGCCCSIPAASKPPVAIYSIYSFITIAYDECYPLFLLAPISSGGMAMKTESIGTVMAATALGNSLAMFVVFPLVSRRIESKLLFRVSSTACGILMLLPPLISSISIVLGGSRHAAVWVLLIIHNILTRFAISCSFTSLFVCINDSAPTEIRATVNGVAMSVASAFKAVGPSLGAIVFAWSLSGDKPIPFDHHFVFVSVSLFCFLVALVALFAMNNRA